MLRIIILNNNTTMPWNARGPHHTLLLKISLGFLLQKTPKNKILKLKDENKKICNKTALPSDWSKVLKNRA